MHLHPHTVIFFPYTTFLYFFFFFNHTATTEIYTLSLHDALPIYRPLACTPPIRSSSVSPRWTAVGRSEEHTSELQSHSDLVCRLLLEKKKTNNKHEQLLGYWMLAILTHSSKHPSATASVAHYLFD